MTIVLALEYAEYHLVRGGEAQGEVGLAETAAMGEADARLLDAGEFSGTRGGAGGAERLSVRRRRSVEHKGKTYPRTMDLSATLRPRLYGLGGPWA